MEYADGGTLRDYFKKKFDELTWDQKFSLGYQLSSAVSCLHTEGIVHRDLVFILICSLCCSLSSHHVYLNLFIIS